MAISKKIAAMAALAAALCLMGSCAGTKLKLEQIPLSENPMEQASSLENDINAAQKNQLDVLAPIWFGKAKTSLNRSKQGLEGGAELSEIFEEISRGRAQLRHAEEMAELVKTALGDVIKARDRARTAGAAALGDDYDKAEGQFLKLTKAIENNDLYWAQKNRVKTIRDFDRLELLAIKKKALGEARSLISRAVKEGALKTSPQTLVRAQKRLSAADAFISENRYQEKEIRAHSQEALFQARRLLQVKRQSEKVRTLKPEEITLWFEEMLHTIADKLSAPDKRDEAFETQRQVILDSVAALQKDHQSAVSQVKVQQAELEGMNKQIVSLEGQAREEQLAKERIVREEQAARERLAAEKRFQQFFNELRRNFGPTEAEVYKQGDQLVIRLKAIQFPVGKAVIMPGNYALLSKVQRAIRTFHEPEVVIEGHTDSTGSEELNERLSQQRAEAVREYLVANRTLTYEKILALGYGSNRPLASNATEEGRAINRRIDVLITPQLRTQR